MGASSQSDATFVSDAWNVRTPRSPVAAVVAPDGLREVLAEDDSGGQRDRRGPGSRQIQHTARGRHVSRNPGLVVTLSLLPVLGSTAGAGIGNVLARGIEALLSGIV